MSTDDQLRFEREELVRITDDPVPTFIPRRPCDSHPTVILCRALAAAFWQLRKEGKSPIEAIAYIDDFVTRQLNDWLEDRIV